MRLLALLLLLGVLAPLLLQACEDTPSSTSHSFKLPPDSPASQDETAQEDDDAVLSARADPEHEASVLGSASPKRLRDALYAYTRKAHLAGSPEDERLGRWTQLELLKRGLDEVWLEPTKAVLSIPVSRPRVALLARDGRKVLFEASLSEDVLPEDATSDSTRFRNTTFHGYSPSGNATGLLVYANYGRPRDFDLLEAAGVGVAGRIVLVRYGEIFRGLKVWNAQLRGAVGVLIYSDPQEDGYVAGEVYPKGPWRPESSVQRGSVQFNSLCAGDPFRADRGGEPAASIAACGYPGEAMVPKIPSLPLSYRDATPLLRALTGADVPEDFRGGLRLPYRFGPTETEVVMSVHNARVTREVYNVIGVIKGALYGTNEDRPVILGNHRDAWVFGAVDPGSGSAAMLEVAHLLGGLRRDRKWTPKRSVYFASWSGEELGLLGSTAWVERHHPGILTNAVVYLNVDIAVAGAAFQLFATPSLSHLVGEVLKRVNDPKTKKPLIDSWSRDTFVLGSGSDYTAFLDNVGIPSLDMRFSAARDAGAKGGLAQYGVYHSVYDSFDWMASQGDPEFEYHAALTKIWTLLALRFADAPRLPFRLDHQARALLGYVERVRPMLSAAQAVELTLAVLEFGRATRGLTRRAAGSLAALNDKLAFTERRFLHPKGLPRRPYFKHVLQAPGLFMGYGADVFPGIVQARRDEKDDRLVAEQWARVVERVRAATAYVRARGAAEEALVATARLRRV